MNDKWDSYWKDELNQRYWLDPDKSVLNLVENLDRTRIKDVLDLGCGIGRHALLLARIGFNVTAVDSSIQALSFLQEQAQKEGSSIQIILDNNSHDIFSHQTFDFILSYNVLYHGYKEEFRKAIDLIHQWLKPGGLLFFTCPTRKDGKYGNGEQVATHTFKPLNSEHPGDIHYFCDEADISDFLRDFSQYSKNVVEHYYNNRGTQQFSSYWQIVAIN